MKNNKPYINNEPNNQDVNHSPPKTFAGDHIICINKLNGILVQILSYMRGHEN